MGKRKVAACGARALVLLVSGAIVRVYSFNNYQSARLKNWLAHFGIGSYATDADSTINYVNSMFKNSLGCIVGCSCGVAISLQSLSSILIVFSFLPLTDSVLPFFASGLSFTVVDYVLLGLVLSIYRYKDIRTEKYHGKLILQNRESTVE